MESNPDEVTPELEAKIVAAAVTRLVVEQETLRALITVMASRLFPRDQFDEMVDQAVAIAAGSVPSDETMRDLLEDLRKEMQR